MRAPAGAVGLGVVVAIASVALLPRPARAERPPLQSELDTCAQRAAEQGDRAMLGLIRFDLLRRADGQVYAAYVHGEEGVDDRQLEGCIVQQMLLWRFGDAQTIDYTMAYPLRFQPSSDNTAAGTHNGQTQPGVMMPEWHFTPAPMKLNVKAAQATLQLSDDTTTPERGIAELSVHDYAKAIPLLRDALEKRPDDPIALRGLAIALAESGGDLAEARALAERLIGLAPRSEGGHEALLRVCLAAKDDLCAFKQWKAANSADDLSPRAYLLRDLEAPTREAAGRLAAAAKQQAANGMSAQSGAKSAGPGGGPAATQVVDPCAKEQGDEAQALCVVKRCLDQGSAVYAAELSKQNSVDYAVGDWRAKQAGANRMLVVRPIQPKTPGAGPAHDALWLVKLGESFVILPSNTEARQITLTHNACAARRLP